MRGVLLANFILVASAGCGDDELDGTGGASGTSDAASGSTAAGAGDPGGVLEVFHPDLPPVAGQTACTIEVRTGIPIASPAQHLDLCTPITYPTNPPAGGNHWPRWAAFATYDAPVRHEMLVHDLEHGAILMLHDCAECGTSITDVFSKVQIDHGIDQKCIPSGGTARFIIAPDPDLDFPIAMAAWGATYNATCIDEASIAAFVEAHYAKGTEDICAPGIDPTTVGCP